ncbi:UNVERIFIED_CONTAM: hypothetical protein GTU68_039090 [Idotea baltica]|nr:hypothetical protein [Idotea baltica]
MSCQIGTDVAEAAKLIAAGGLVAFPTETVYGLGANALNVTAVANVFAAKGRPKFDPLIVHLQDATAAADFAAEWTTTAARLAEEFWPGPLSLVVPRNSVIPDLVTSGMESVALRVPEHPVAQQLLASTGLPIAAPSANLFGRVSPTTATHVAEQLGDHIDYILDGGPCRVGIESTVVSLLDQQPSVLRLGGVSLEDLSRMVGEIPVHSVGDEAAPQAPGQLLKHYAPRIPISIVSCAGEYRATSDEQAGLLVSQPTSDTSPFAMTEVLSPTGDLVECAAGFFAALRRMDASGIDRIVAVRFRDEGLGRALNDRLTRAAAR